MPFVVFSGLPGSGKSTLARKLAPELGLPILDKDEFLDALFDERGVGDWASRTALSREADSRFVAAAQSLTGGACLVSWWRHPRATDVASGTPADWLRTLRGPVIELYCHCSIETATNRFLARKRHRGHGDSRRSELSVGDQFRALVAAPLAFGPVIVVTTEEPVSVAPLTRQVRDALSAYGRDPDSAA